MEGIGFDAINLLQLTGQVINALGTGRGSPHQKYKQAKGASASLRQALNGLKAAPQVDANLSRLYDQLLLNEQQIEEVLKEYNAALARPSRFYSFPSIWKKLKFEFSEAAQLLDQINRAQPLIHAAILQGQGQTLTQLTTVGDRLDRQNTSTLSFQKTVQEGFTRSEIRLQDAVRDLSGQLSRSRGVLTDDLRLQRALAAMNRQRLEQRFDTTDALVRRTLTHVSTEMTKSSDEIKRFILQNGPRGTGVALAAEFCAAGLTPYHNMNSLDRLALTASTADSSSFELLTILVWRVLMLFSYLIVLPAEVAKMVDNRIEIETAHGRKLRVPWEYWQSPETLHGFFLFHFRGTSGFDHVRAESYTLLQGGPHGTVVDFRYWAEQVKRKSKLTQVLLVEGSRRKCPRCASTVQSQRGLWRKCNVCSFAFRLGSDPTGLYAGLAYRGAAGTESNAEGHYVTDPSHDVLPQAALKVGRIDLSQILHIILRVSTVRFDLNRPEARESDTISEEDDSSDADDEDSDSDSDDKLRLSRPAITRKKSGELIRPALRTSSSRHPSSMPGTPTYSKAVHFDSHLEHVRHFLQVDRPYNIKAESSPVEN